MLSTEWVKPTPKIRTVPGKFLRWGWTAKFSEGLRGFFSEKDSGGWWVNDKGNSGGWSLFSNVRQLEKTFSKYYLSRSIKERVKYL